LRQYYNFSETIKSYVKYDFIAYVIVIYSVYGYNNVVIDIFEGELKLIDEFRNFWGCTGRMIITILCICFYFTNANSEGFTPETTTTPHHSTPHRTWPRALARKTMAIPKDSQSITDGYSIVTDDKGSTRAKI